MVDAIAKRIGVFPEDYLDGKQGEENKKLLKETAVIPSQFRLQAPYSKPAISLKVIKECYEKFFI